MNIKYETQSGLVAAEIEKGIRTGIFPPGSRLPSIREFAELFHVSTQVIKSAFKLLTERKLLVSRSRIGVFVNVDGILPETKKLVLLNGSRGPNDKNYLGRVFGLSESMMSYRGFHIQMRTVPTGPFLLPALQYEVHQIETDRPDCLVVTASLVPPDEIGNIMNRGFPVIFFGDFIHGDIPGAEYDLIRERTEERGAAFIEAAWKIGCKKVCVFGGQPRFFYVRRLLDGMKECADRYGITFYSTNGRPNAQTENEIIRNWKTHIRAVLDVFTPDAFISDGFGHMDLFLRALEELGFTPGKDIQVLSDTDFSPGLIMIRSDYSEFVSAAVSIIRRTIEEPGYHCGIMEIAGKIKRTPFKIEAV